MNEIIVGNIGNVYYGSDDAEARKVFHKYVGQSRMGYGRAAGEDVTWMQNGEIKREYIGQRSNNEPDNV